MDLPFYSTYFPHQDWPVSSNQTLKDVWIDENTSKKNIRFSDFTLFSSYTSTRGTGLPEETLNHQRSTKQAPDEPGTLGSPAG